MQTIYGKCLACVEDVKYCFSDDNLPDGFSLNIGDIVNYQPFAMGRMKFLWGDDAEEFRPERWLNEDGVFEPESPFKFTAFQVSSSRPAIIGIVQILIGTGTTSIVLICSCFVRRELLDNLVALPQCF